MYHHRYQPLPHLAHKNAPAFANNNNSIGSLPSNSQTSIAASNNHSFNSYHNNNNINNNFNNTIYSGLPINVIEERQDVIFRKVRGILNKITPETFDKLSKELVNVGLDSPRTLRGVIYLLFDKALKDLKYSSLYAKLCQELSEKAPNFETEPGPNTFCKFLISKCEDEFERRRKATEDFDCKNELTDEEYELKAIAKQKMLGNIKFICELGKKRLLQEEILHECIRGLLSKKKERPIQDQAQDLECLCQIMRTIGSLLDIQASRNLMNQYFERIDLFSKKPELPSRIRFMLRDVIDLRNNNWRPRPYQREDNVPQPLSKLREDLGFDQDTSTSLDKFGNNKSLIGISDLSKLHGNKLSMFLDDEPSFTTTTDFHWGPSLLPSMVDPFDAFSSNNSGSKSRSSTSKLSQPINMAHQLNHPNPSNVGLIINKPNVPHNHDPFADIHRFRVEKQYNNTVPKHSNDLQRRVIDDGKMTLDHRPNSHAMSTYRNERDAQLFNLRNKAIVGTHPTGAPHREDHLNPVRKIIDPRPPPPSHHHNQATIRNGDISPSSRQPTRRKINDPMPAQGWQPTNLEQQNVSRKFRIDPRDSHPIESSTGREWRGHPNDQRNPNFHQSSTSPIHQDDRRIAPRFANQALNQPRNIGDPFPRQECPQHLDKLSQPESETNFNWRSGSLAVASNIQGGDATNISPHVGHRASGPRMRDNPLGPRLGVERYGRSNTVHNKTGTGDSYRKPDEYRSERRHNSNRGFDSAGNAREDSGPNKSVGPSNNQVNGQVLSQRQPELNVDRLPQNRANPLPQRAANVQPVSQTTKREPNPSTSSRDPIQGSSDRHDFKLAHTDSNERREFRRIQIPNQQDIQNQPKHADNGLSSRYEKPTSNGRNTRHSDSNAASDRGPNWRRGQANNASAFAPSKEQPAVLATLNPLLSKPPMRLTSDTNFSLRPSHNLSGITVGGNGSLRLQKFTPETTLPQREESKEINQTQSETSKPVVQSQQDNTQDPKAGAKVRPTSLADGSNSQPMEDSNRAAARDFHVNKFMAVLTECFNESSPNIGRATSKIKDLKVPTAYQHECLVNAMKQAILKSETDRDNLGKLFAQLIPSIFEASSMTNSFTVVFKQLQALEVEIPKVKSLVAGFLSQAIVDGLTSLEEIGDRLAGGKHHPLFLLSLQKLNQAAGQTKLNEKFVASKINLLDMLPEADRSKDRLASILKDRCLEFLDPMLTIEPDLWEQMKTRDPSPAAIYRWIKENVDKSIQTNPTFAHVLITCLVRYICGVASEKSKVTNVDQSSASEGPNSNKSSPSSSSQSTSDVESELLIKYQQVLQALLKEKKMQLATLYALQSFYHNLDFPKGALLRWFHMLYDMNVVDDDVFLVWKEEINDEYPGKGQALFQVNTWLNWLAESESEEEDDA